jgi:hypothetical protein
VSGCDASAGATRALGRAAAGFAGSARRLGSGLTTESSGVAGLRGDADTGAGAGFWPVPCVAEAIANAAAKAAAASAATTTANREGATTDI